MASVFRIDAKINVKDALLTIDALGKEGKAAVIRSINRTVQGTQNLAIDLTKTELNLKESKIRKRMKIGRASKAGLEGKVTIVAKPSPLMDFEGTTFRRKSRGGVTVKVKRAGSRAVLKHAFILDLASGKRVFVQDLKKPKRKSKRGRLEHPLKALTSTFVSQFIGGPKQLAVLTRYVGQRFNKELAQELRYRLRKRQGFFR